MALPARDHRISLTDAAALTRRHREADPSGVKAGTFDRAQVLALLEQPACVALRVYFGRHADGTPAQEHWPCPPVCGAANPLNT